MWHAILPNVAHNSTSDTSLFTAHCTLHTDFRVVKSGECITTQPIHVSYCSGACGNSSSIPLLIISGDQTGNNGVQQDCKCCTGTVASIQTVGVICGPNKVPATAQIAAMSSCSCDECIQLGTWRFIINVVSFIMFQNRWIFSEWYNKTCLIRSPFAQFRQVFSLHNYINI